MNPNYWKCERCKDTYHKKFDNMRSRSGSFTEEHPDGTAIDYELLCEDCHRDVVRA